MKTTTRHAVLALAIAGLLTVPTVAMAAPWKSALADILPDADVYCDGDTDPVDGFVGHPSAATMWIDDDSHGGHYVVEASVHYFAPGLWFAPVEDLASFGFPVVGDVTYGERKGLDHAMTCQFVSRWADPEDPAKNFTIYADVDLAGPLGAG